MEEKKTEGLLLKAIPYLEGQKILKVLTPNDGLISVIAKKKHQKFFLDPYLVAEWVLKKTKSEIFPLIDVSISHDLLEIRKELSSITAAAKIAETLLKTQMSGRPSPQIYALAVAFLKKISQNLSLLALTCSFQLKLLSQEGWLASNLNCSFCKSAATGMSSHGQFCQTHFDPTGIPLSSYFFERMQILKESKSFLEITKVNVDQEFSGNIDRIFELFSRH